MRFAIKTSPQHTNFADMLAVWQAADDIDLFESGWTFDHFYPIFSDHTGPCLEGWVTTTALAQATKRLRVGVLVTGNVYRHPAVLANMAASLDVISNGRLEFGIGAGWNQQECDAYGIDLPPLRERFDMFDEAVEVMVKLFTETTADFAGKHYQLNDAYCEPKPVQTAASADRDRGRWREADAAHRRALGAALERPRRRCRRVQAQARRAARRTATRSGATSRRSRRPRTFASTPTTSTRCVAEAEAFAEAGLDLGIVYLPPPHTPAVLEPLAKALQPLAG